MPRIFDHKKQYACTEVFQLEELQNLASELEDEDYNDRPCVHAYQWRAVAQHYVYLLTQITKSINEFIKTLDEQEKRK